MSNEMRSAIAAFMNLNLGNDMSSRLQLSYPLHPRLQKIYKYLEPEFTRLIVKEHDLLSQEKHRKRVLDYMPDADFRNKCEADWKKNPNMSGVEMWEKWN